MKKSRIFFLLIPFSNYLKKAHLLMQKYLGQFFCSYLFQIFKKKSILTKLKIPTTVFFARTLSKYLTNAYFQI